MMLFFSISLMLVLAAAAAANEDPQCKRQVWSVLNPNFFWMSSSHTYHPQVWYHTLEDIYALWSSSPDYFDYVLDVRTIQDSEFEGNVLPGWETAHIPGSYPIPLCTGEDDDESSSCDTGNLEDFTSSAICKDSRILVHCWVGVAANQAAKQLIAAGFTNLHLAGPEGNAGFFQWEENGYELVYNDTFDPQRVPECARQCSSSSSGKEKSSKAAGKSKSSKGKSHKQKSKRL